MGAILAAGEGRRIQPFSGFVPKPLLPLLDRSLLAWQLAQVRACGITEVVVVVGHLGAQVRAALGDGSRYGVTLEYVEQGQVLGIAHAVGRLEGVVDRPFLLLLGDVHFVTDRLPALLALHGDRDTRAALAVKQEDDEAALRLSFTVESDADGFVRRVVATPTAPATRTTGCGLYVFDDSVFEAVRATPRSALRGEYELTDAIQVLIDSGHRVRAAAVIESDLNLSTPADLLRLNLQELVRRDLPRYVAPDARVDAGARVVDSVVLAGASIPSGASLERCLVMPGERVEPGEYRDEVLVEGNRLWMP